MGNENEKIAAKSEIKEGFNLRLTGKRGTLQILKGVNETDKIKMIKKKYLNDFGDNYNVDNVIWTYNDEEMYNNKTLSEHNIIKENILPIIVIFDDDDDSEKECAVASFVFDEHKKEEIKNNEIIKNDDGTPYGGRWPHGIVPYIIDESVTDHMRILINNAINEFNTKTPVQWIQRSNEIIHVIFKEDGNDKDSFSQIGCTFTNEPHLILLSDHVPGTKQTEKLKMCHVIHEMMHTLGFVHEQQRWDATKHHQSYLSEDVNCWRYEQYISFGQYDYKSVMHYAYVLMKSINTEEIAQEMRENIGKLDTFSAGDIAAIKRLYGLRNSHYGEWHEACFKKECTEKICYCGSCGKIEGGVWCSWYGKRNTNGHWTCCMSEDKLNKRCETRNHTGYYHLACMQSIDKRKCTKIRCFCGSCGGGCQFGGNTKIGHWSCCGTNNQNGWCTNSPYTKTN